MHPRKILYLYYLFFQFIYTFYLFIFYHYILLEILWNILLDLHWLLWYILSVIYNIIFYLIDVHDDVNVLFLHLFNFFLNILHFIF